MEHGIKVVFMGESSVGKSSIVARIYSDTFSEYQTSTIGATFLTKTLILNNKDKDTDKNTDKDKDTDKNKDKNKQKSKIGKNTTNLQTVKLEIWDTAGQERYNSLVPLYYRQAKIAIIVYDITSLESFAKAKYWLSELQNHCFNHPLIILVGNKNDIEADYRKVSSAVVEEYAKANGCICIEVSAKTNHGIINLLDIITNNIPKLDLDNDQYYDNRSINNKIMSVQKNRCCF